MPKKDIKTDLRSQIGFLFISTFLKGVIIQKDYTQIVFSSIVAKVSTLAFSGISESFLRPLLRKHRKKFQLTFLPLGCSE
jgi:hypothetical protein